MTYLFKPYTSVPKSTDLNFINTSKGGYSHCIKRTAAGYTLPNCVAFAHGMWLKTLTDARGLEEAKAIESRMCRGNAEAYWNYADGFERGNTPKLNAIMVWEGKGSLLGHVMTVTTVKPGGDVIATGSDYSGSKFYTKTYYKSNNYAINSSYIFRGFIYCPYEFVYTIGTPVPRNSSVDQIQVKSDILNVRVSPTTASPSQGYCVPGIYNVMETRKDSNYIWYRIDHDKWIANNKEATWCTFLPMTVPKYNITLLNLNRQQRQKMENIIRSEGIEYKVVETI